MSKLESTNCNNTRVCGCQPKKGKEKLGPGRLGRFRWEGATSAAAIADDYDEKCWESGNNDEEEVVTTTTTKAIKCHTHARCQKRKRSVLVVMGNCTARTAIHTWKQQKKRPRLQMSAQKLTRLALSCSVFPADSGCRDLKRSGAGQSRSSSDSTFFPSFFLLINTVKEIKARSKEEKKKASDKEVGDSVCVAGKLLEHYCQENKNERKNKERKVRAC